MARLTLMIERGEVKGEVKDGSDGRKYRYVDEETRSRIIEDPRAFYDGVTDPHDDSHSSRKGRSKGPPGYVLAQDLIGHSPPRRKLLEQAYHLGIFENLITTKRSGTGLSYYVREEVSADHLLGTLQNLRRINRTLGRYEDIMDGQDAITTEEPAGLPAIEGTDGEALKESAETDGTPQTSGEMAKLISRRYAEGNIDPLNVLLRILGYVPRDDVYDRIDRLAAAIEGIGPRIEEGVDAAKEDLRKYFDEDVVPGLLAELAGTNSQLPDEMKAEIVGQVTSTLRTELERMGDTFRKELTDYARSLVAPGIKGMPTHADEMPRDTLHGRKNPSGRKAKRAPKAAAPTRAQAPAASAIITPPPAKKSGYDGRDGPQGETAEPSVRERLCEMYHGEERWINGVAASDTCAEQALGVIVDEQPNAHGREFIHNLYGFSDALATGTYAGIINWLAGRDVHGFTPEECMNAVRIIDAASGEMKARVANRISRITASDELQRVFNRTDEELYGIEARERRVGPHHPKKGVGKK